MEKENCCRHGEEFKYCRCCKFLEFMKCHKNNNGCFIPRDIRVLIFDAIVIPKKPVCSAQFRKASCCVRRPTIVGYAICSMHVRRAPKKEKPQPQPQPQPGDLLRTDGVTQPKIRVNANKFKGKLPKKHYFTGNVNQRRR